MPVMTPRRLDPRAGEVWGAESGTDRLVVIRTAARAETGHAQKV